MPLPDSAIPLASELICRTSVNCAEAGVLQNSNPDKRSHVRVNSASPTATTHPWLGFLLVGQFAVAVKLIVLVMAPAASVKGMVSFTVYEVLP